MAKSALLKSSLAKKYWMALTGLFLCLFLVGHLAGNLQLIFGTALQFNEYAYFMTTNPAVKILSYVTYISILFHAIDGIVLTVQNKKARPVGYAKNNAQANSGFASRNMAVLGTLILVFIATHMVNFWAKMHFEEMPLQKMEVNNVGEIQSYYYTTQVGKYIPEDLSRAGLVIRNGNEFHDGILNIKIAEGYKDLHKIVMAFFKDESFGLWATLFYIFSMLVMAFHLWHGFQSAFQSIGFTNPNYASKIKFIGKAFAIVVPLLFAVIPFYIHFILKA